MRDLRCDCDAPAPACDPFRDEEEFGRNFILNPFGIYNSGVTAFHTDIRDNGDSYCLEMDLPGFTKENIDVSLVDDRLSIKAERHRTREETDGDGKYLQRERSFGAYSRSFNVRDISTADIRATFDNGVLSITLPKKTPTHPSRRKLDIN